MSRDEDTPRHALRILTPLPPAADWQARYERLKAKWDALDPDKGMPAQLIRDQHDTIGQLMVWADELQAENERLKRGTALTTVTRRTLIQTLEDKLRETLRAMRDRR